MAMPTTKITIDESGNQILHSVGPAATPLPPSAGQPVSSLSAGNRNAVHGQVNATSIVQGPVFDNPA